ncbi:MAG: nucleotidyl transferase AbiEii/AbiGii toxin family protein [Syntrophaceae bacterium]|nr:nucleotidyl transferase AbiEii/AbiGii toxin family protein [Syntrophaceae bacterium]
MAAVSFTAKETTFSTRLVEKDYFCTVLLEYLITVGNALVFKGGTCLAKIHADFYRLSEDLDFVVSMPVDSSRSERSKMATGLKDVVNALPARLPGFRVVEPLTGANNSTQYNTMIGYHSQIVRKEEIINVEVGLREPLLLPPEVGMAKTLLLNPATAKPLYEPLVLNCMSKREAFAEKFRAALSRREAAVRDFFDLDFAVRRLGLQPNDSSLIELVRQKMAVPGNEPVDISPERLAALRRQLDTELKTVLREKDFREFDLERAFRIVKDVAAIIG